MLLPDIARRWVVTLLVLVFCTGLGTPAFAGLLGGGHHTPAAVVAHGTCLHAGAGASQDDPDDPSASAADCALAHLGQALLDRAAPLLVRVRACPYPPVTSNGLVERVPALEADPPRSTRIA